MRAVFKNQPLSDDETFALAAMLGEATDARRSSPTSSGTRRFVAIALGLALAVFATMAAVWGRRMTGVRRSMVAAARARVGDQS